MKKKMELYHVDIDIWKNEQIIEHYNSVFINNTMAQCMRESKEVLTFLCHECGINLKILRQHKTKALTKKPFEYNHSISITKIYDNVDLESIAKRIEMLSELYKTYGDIKFDYRKEAKSTTFGEQYKVYYDIYGRWIERYELVLDFKGSDGLAGIPLRRELSDYKEDAGTKFSDCDVIWCHDPDNVYHIPKFDKDSARPFGGKDWVNDYPIYDNTGASFGFIHESELSKIPKKEPDAEQNEC